MTFKVSYNNEIIELNKPTSILNIVGDNKSFICAKVNNRLRELTYVIEKDSTIEVLTDKDNDAIKFYEASLRYLITMAMHNIDPSINIRISYNVSRALFIHFLDKNRTATTQLTLKLEKEMARLVSLNLPLNRIKLPKEDVIKIFEKEKAFDKVKLLSYRPEKTAHIYECNGYKNYMSERMVPSTGYIKKYKIKFYYPGIIIQYPRSECDGNIPEFKDAPIYGRTLKRAHSWATTTRLDTVANINDAIKEFGDVNLINICEHKHNQQFAELGDLIEKDIDSVRIICVAGPSSSGKTTFANRLRVELLSRGINPIRISIDDYYLPKKDMPLDENGNPDLEHLKSIDIDLFNKNMTDLIEGLEVSLPKHDFINDSRTFERTVKLSPNQHIIFEVIQALNDELTYSIPRHQKFKIFISPQSQINLDNHNPMSLTNIRLIRRIVRDYKFRNSSALETLSMWKNVRKGEFKWIYDNQENADYVFNSLLNYELCVLKKYALPLLQEIEVDSPYFPLAERLIRMLKFFSNLDDKWVPCNSLLKEFIGGSCYED